MSNLKSEPFTDTRKSLVVMISSLRSRHGHGEIVFGFRLNRLFKRCVGIRIVVIV